MISIGMIVVICAGLLVTGVVALFAIAAVENIRIAKHTGRDPRKNHTTLKGSGAAAQSVVDAGERVARDGA